MTKIRVLYIYFEHIRTIWNNDIIHSNNAIKFMVNLYIVGRVFNFLGSVSPQQKFEAMDGPALQHSFICQAKENTSLGMKAGRPKRIWREERPEAQFWLLFLYVFLLSLSLPCVNWASQEGCFFHLRFSIWFSDLPLFYFCRLFLSLSFSHRYFGLLFLILTT